MDLSLTVLITLVGTGLFTCLSPHLDLREQSPEGWRKDGIIEGNTCPLWAAPPVLQLAVVSKWFLWDAVKASRG